MESGNYNTTSLLNTNKNNFSSHPKYRQALQKKFPSLACTAEPSDDATSQVSGVTNVNDDKPDA